MVSPTPPGFVSATYSGRNTHAVAECTQFSGGQSNVLHRPERRTQALIDEVYREALEKRAGKAFASWARSEVTWHGPRSEMESRLHELVVPTLLIQGAQDKLVLVSFARRAHELIVHSRLSILPECGHWVQRDDPQAFLQTVEPF